MRPRSAYHNEPDGSPVNAILACELALTGTTGGMGGTNGDYLGLGQLGLMVTFAAPGPARSPALCYHVGYVGFGRAKEKVIRPHTARIVALMAHVKRLVEGAVVHLVRQTMGAKNNRRAWPAANHAIAAVRRCTRPQPAAVGLLDVLPKTVLEWD